MASALAATHLRLDTRLTVEAKLDVLAVNAVCIVAVYAAYQQDNRYCTTQRAAGAAWLPCKPL